MSPTFNIKATFGLDRVFPDRVRVLPIIAARMRTLRAIIDKATMAGRRAEYAFDVGDTLLAYEDIHLCANRLDEAQKIITMIMRDSDDEFDTFCNFDEDLDD
jgi:hypothetical protein